MSYGASQEGLVRNSAVGAEPPLEPGKTPAFTGSGETNGPRNETRLYAAVFVVNGEVREFAFPARSLAEAREFCVGRGFGLKGLVSKTTDSENDAAALTIEEVISVLQLSRSTIWRLIRQRRLKCLAGIRAVRVTRRSLQEYLAS